MRKTLLQSEDKATQKCGRVAEPEPRRQTVKHRQRKLAQTYHAGAVSWKKRTQCRYMTARKVAGSPLNADFRSLTALLKS